jgi:hypothetical protein
MIVLKFLIAICYLENMEQNNNNDNNNNNNKNIIDKMQYQIEYCMGQIINLICEMSKNDLCKKVIKPDHIIYALGVIYAFELIIKLIKKIFCKKAIIIK